MILVTRTPSESIRSPGFFRGLNLIFFVRKQCNASIAERIQAATDIVPRPYHTTVVALPNIIFFCHVSTCWHRYLLLESTALRVHHAPVSRT